MKRFFQILTLCFIANIAQASNVDSSSVLPKIQIMVAPPSQSITSFLLDSPSFQQVALVQMQIKCREVIQNIQPTTTDVNDKKRLDYANKIMQAKYNDVITLQAIRFICNANNLTDLDNYVDTIDQLRTAFEDSTKFSQLAGAEF
jgi:hypothetical protein